MRKVYQHLLMIHNLVDVQAQEIVALKKRIQRLERKKMSRPIGLKRLKKIGMTRRVESSEDQEIDETQERQGDDLMFDTQVLEDDEMHVEAKVDGKEEQSTKPDDSTAGEAVTTASVEVSVVNTTIKKITLAQTLIQIKAAKPKVVTTAATTITTKRPKDRGVVVEEPSKFRVLQETQPSSSKDKGKATLDAELLEEQKLSRKQEEEANIALIESWENTQAMMEADRLLAERLQSKEREELTDEEKAKQFMELMEKRRKHFAALKAQEKRNRPPTKAQKRTQMSTYLKHMGGYIYKQLKGNSFDEIQKLFDKEMKRVNTFVAMGSEVQERKENKEEVKEEKELEEVDEVELKKLLVIKNDEDIAIDAIQLATKLPVIIDYKLHEEGIDREDLEALWRIVKAKYGDTRHDNEFKRVLWGDLKVMFESDKRSDVWRILQGYRVTIWKLIDLSRVHFIRRNLKIPKMNIKFRGGLLGLKRLHRFLEVTAALVHNGNYAKWKHFKTLSLDESRSPDFDLFSDQEEYSEEEVAEIMAETMEQYISKTRADYGSGVARPKIEDKDNFKLKGQFLKELRTNTFSDSDHEDVNEHLEKVLKIMDLFHIPNLTIDQVILRAFPMSLIGAASHWLRNKPSGSITTWEDLKTKFLSKHFPPARTTKKMEEISNFQQEPDGNLYQA
ncbi:hypothetical protein Tco_1282302 [Tanacetum coccineum]